jgi:hypothetical protein
MAYKSIRALACTLAILLLAGCGGGGSSSSTPTYTIGGSVSGLTGSGLVLQLNGGNDLAVSADGAFSFPAMGDGSSYAVTVKSQPANPSETCTIGYGSGTLAGADVTNVAVQCAVNTYTVSGSVSGLTGSGLVLQLNGGNDLAVSADGAFTLPAIADGSAYAVTVTTQPTKPSQLCAVTNGSGTLAGSNVGNVQVSCAAAFTIGVGVYGLKNAGLVLQLNGADDLTVNDSGEFAFPVQLDGSSYSVTVKTQATGTSVQSCSVANGSGTLSGADVSLQVTCSPWTKQFGGGSDTEAYTTATDADGNLYVVGYTDQGLDGNPRVGSPDAFLVKYDRYGKRLYTREWAAAAGARATGVALDASGNVYVAGNTYGGLDGNVKTGVVDVFITKFDPAGNRHTWQLGAAGAYTFATGVALDAGGNVYLAGYTNVGLDGNTQAGIQDLFVTKFDPAGNHHTWQLGAAGAETYGKGVAVDSSGNVYVAGYTYGGLDGNTKSGIYDLFVTQYDPAGNHHTWQLGAAGANTYGTGVALDASGNVYVAGYTNGALDGNTRTGDYDFLVTKYDPAGNHHTWQLGAAGAYTNATGVALDVDGNVYVAGYTYGGLDGNTQAGAADAFITKYDPAGSHVTSQLGVAGGSYTYATGIALDASGHVYVAGFTYGALDGNALMSTNGNADSFVAKYDTNGNKQ